MQQIDENAVEFYDDEGELIRKEIKRRPLLQFLEYLRKGEIRKSREDARFAPFQYQYDFLKSSATQVFAIGANACGKTQLCSIKSALTLLGYNRLIPAPCDGVIVSLDWPKARDVSIPMLFELINPASIRSWNKTEKTLKLKNGSTCVFMSADSGRTKFQGLRKDFIAIDEEIDEEVYKECLMRAKAGKLLYLWGAALPFFGYETYLYKDIFCKARKGSNIEVYTATIYDNFALNPGFIAEREKDYHGAEAKIRLLGKFVSLLGFGIFDGEKLQEIKKQYCQKTETIGRIIEEEGQKIRFVTDHEQGRWKIWKHPETGEVYSLGVDVATGTTMSSEGDASCIQVLKGSTQEQVACYYGIVTEDELAVQVIRGAKLYNESPVIIEITGGYGRAVQTLVMRGDYYNLYRRVTYDTWGQVVSEHLGWETSGGRNESGNKAYLLTDGKKYVRELGIIRDEDTIFEFTNYIRHKDGSSGARGGCKDDRVMAYLIALRQINEGNCEKDILVSREEVTTETGSYEERMAWLHGG